MQKKILHCQSSTWLLSVLCLFCYIIWWCKSWNIFPSILRDRLTSSCPLKNKYKPYNMTWSGSSPQNQWFYGASTKFWYHKNHEKYIAGHSKYCSRFHEQKWLRGIITDCWKWEIVAVFIGDKGYPNKDSENYYAGPFLWFDNYMRHSMGLSELGYPLGSHWYIDRGTHYRCSKIGHVNPLYQVGRNAFPCIV